MGAVVHDPGILCGGHAHCSTAYPCGVVHLCKPTRMLYPSDQESDRQRESEKGRSDITFPATSTANI